MLAPARSSFGERLRRSALRREGELLQRNTILERATLLPPEERALLVAWVQHAVPLEELSALYGVTKRQVRRRLDVLRHKISDPEFLLAMRYGKRLPEEIQPLAYGRWVQGRSLRTLAAERGESLYQVRRALEHAWSLMTYFAGHEQARILEMRKRREAEAAD